MKKIGIFSSSVSEYTPQRLFEEGNKIFDEVILLPFWKTKYSFADKSTKISNLKNEKLPFVDALILRGGTFSPFSHHKVVLLDYFRSLGTFILNGDSLKLWPNLDKLTQHFILQHNRIPVIPTLMCSNSTSFIDHCASFPLIVKAVAGSRGRQVFKINNLDQAKEVLKKFRPWNLLIEPFLPGGEDLRIIVIGGKAIGAMKRISQSGSYLTNYSAGGKVENFALESDPVLQKIAEKTANIFKCDYAGIDLIKDKDIWRVLEINRDCQFEGFEKATGVNVAQTLMKFLLTKIGKYDKFRRVEK